jgi:hypothetical protein
MNTVDVVFRKFRDGAIVALFPNEINYSDGSCESYQHIGQHGAADYAHCMRVTTPATPNEYKPLYTELVKIGYELNVCKRKRRPVRTVSEYDRALILGNRLRINSAIQELNSALANLRGVESKQSQSNVAKIRKAVNLLVSYNVENTERGVS